jgi:DNA-binding SARP family transcriptional activator
MESRGHRLHTTEGLMVLASFAAEHRAKDAARLFREAVSKARDYRLLRFVRWWARRCTGLARQVARMPDGPGLLVDLLSADPEGWRVPVAAVILQLRPELRGRVLAALKNYPSQDTVDALRGIGGADVAALRRDLIQAMAPRLYIRTFGELTVHRGSWTGPQIPVTKKRLRQLLSLLVAHSDRSITRDEASDALWPEADAISAGNSLNQAAFQLRRSLDFSYRDGESPNYLLTSSDYIELNPQLVVTDLAWVRRLTTRDPALSSSADSALNLIRGSFLPELRFEDWGSGIQASIHAEIRENLLPIAEQRHHSTDATVAVRAACALVEMDPFDERAQIALANALAADGRRVAARESLSRFAERFRREMDEEPSDTLRSVLGALETGSLSTPV